GMFGPDRRADPLAGRAARSRRGRAPPPRGRGQLMLGTAAAVRIDAGRRPEQATHVAVAEWEGPLGRLLSLIEANRLDVLTVPLGALAESYLDALASIEGDRIGSISAFVAVASQLILIKSRAMLPRPPAGSGGPGEVDEGPDPEAELRAR